MNLFIIAAGLLAGLVIGQYLKKPDRLISPIGMTVFEYVLPYLVLAEVSSMPLVEWHFFFYGSAFVLGLFYFGRIFFDRHRSALLATAEGGTFGFVLYNTIGLEPLSRFFLVDMLGNGFVLFSFIYWQVSNRFNLKAFLKNRLMAAMALGIIFNLAGIHLLAYTFPARLEPIVAALTTLLVSAVVGSQIKFNLSREIFLSRFFRQFWLIRLAGLAIAAAIGLPLAMKILFVLPSSFLLPVIYTELHEKEKTYAANFIAASLPVSLGLAFIMVMWL